MRDQIDALIQSLASMPAAMRERSQWLLWRYETYEGDKKPRKVPYYANGQKRSGKQGTPEDRKRLAAFDGALKVLRSGRFDGVGFAFLPGDGMVGVDIDGGIDPDTGEISDLCREVIERCASYTEVSPSGKGVHIILAGDSEVFKNNAIGLEVYCGRLYFTCTGRPWPGAPTQVAELSPELLAWLRATVKGPEHAAAQQQPLAQPGPPGVPQVNDFQRVNAAALALLDAWVPALFPSAKRGADGYRVPSKDLGRELQEDISIHRDGIVDFGVADMGDARQGKRSPIDLVMEWRHLDERGALQWLADRVGVVLLSAAARSGSRPAQARRSRGAQADDRPEPPAEGGSTPAPGSAPGGSQREKGRAEAWRQELVPTNNGGLRDCRENVFTILANHGAIKGLVAYDEFAHRIIKLKNPPWKSDPGEWSNNDDYELGLWLFQTEGLIVRAEGALAAGVAMAAFRARFHPVREYLDGLEWDGECRLKYWLHECLGADESTYHELVGTWYIMGMVNRILNPGCQMDNMITLEGKQGEGKSTALRILAGKWFADTPLDLKNKDALLNLAGVWLYEVAEMDSFNRAEVTAVKQYVTSRVDRVREPYSRRPADRPRSCVLAGTTNQNEYLKDSTGARRFWPVAVGALDLAKLAKWRDQLFAEAKYLLAQGERYYPTRKEEREYILPVQEDREIIDPWLETIALWVDSKEACLRNRFTTAQLLSECLKVPIDRVDGNRSMATRVGTIMHKLGWDKEREATGSRLRYYVRPKVARTDEAGGPARQDVFEDTEVPL